MGTVLFVACTNVGISMIDAIMNSDCIKSKICGIVNLNIQQGSKKANYQTYAEVSEKYNIPIHYCNHVNDAETLAWITEKEPDIIIQSGWSQKFSDELLSIPKYCCIGEHPAPLPKGRGAACVNWAIINGESKWGDSFFEMVSEYDKGALLAQDFFTIEEYDTVKTVYDKVAASSSKIVSAEIDNWTNGIFKKTCQNDEQSTYYKRRTPADGLFDFSMPAKELHDFIRAQTYPYPCAFFKNGKDTVRVVSAEYISKRVQAPTGSIFLKKNGSIDVVCGDGKMIRIKRIKIDSNPECWADEYVLKNGMKAF